MLVLAGRKISYARVASFSIVEDFDSFGNRCLRGNRIQEDRPVDKLDFEGGEEALGDWASPSLMATLAHSLLTFLGLREKNSDSTDT